MNSLGLVTVYLAPNKYPPHPSKTYLTRPHRGGTPLFWRMGPTVPSYILFCASSYLRFNSAPHHPDLCLDVAHTPASQHGLEQREQRPQRMTLK